MLALLTLKNLKNARDECIQWIWVMQIEQSPVVPKNKIGLEIKND